MLALCHATLETLNVNYKINPLTNQRILDTLKHITMTSPAPNQAAWHDYWSSFKEASDPSYLYRDTTFRYKGNYVTAPVDTESRFFTFLREICFNNYFGDVDAIVEFGCGSGGNLKLLKQMFPYKKLYACDWAAAAVNLAKPLATSKYFDMRNPIAVEFAEKRLGVLTTGAMEQLGDNFQPFLEFLLSLKAQIYLHIEPLIELYDDNSLFDYLAILYHQKRNYLGNFYKALMSRVKVIEHCRTGFGNEWNDGYSVLVWQLK
jgi:hypothetical protein